MLREEKRNGDDDLTAATKLSLSTLHVRRQALESEAEAIVSELTTPPAPGVRPPGVDAPLVDEEGYPRNDVDVHRARALRGRLAEIRTDRQALLKESERLLHQLARLQDPRKAEAEEAERAARSAPKPKPKYDAATGKWVVRNWDGTVSGSGSSNDGRSFDSLGLAASSNAQRTNRQGPTAASTAEATGVGTVLLDDAYREVRPFARVDSVAAGSPASEAALLVGDLLLEFGAIRIDGSSYETAEAAMSSVGQAVPQLAASGSAVRVVVRRASQAGGGHVTCALTLTPKPWAGRGLLGCHIMPYK
jgi:26S proteasome non-ATPase regulatory subunit 9